MAVCAGRTLGGVFGPFKHDLGATVSEIDGKRLSVSAIVKIMRVGRPATEMRERYAKIKEKDNYEKKSGLPKRSMDSHGGGMLLILYAVLHKHVIAVELL